MRIKFTQIVCSIFPPSVSQRLRELIYPRVLGIKRKVDFSRKSITGSEFASNTEDFHGYPFLFHGFFDWRNVIIANSIFKKNKGDIIEIGANIGTETISFCDITKRKGKVHAFEPFPKNFNHLKKLLQNSENLILYQQAISDIKSTLSFKVPPLTLSGTGKIVSETKTNDNQIIKVDAFPLDTLIGKFNTVKLIAIDTEGHEPHVLNGSEETISKHRPAVIIEVSPKLIAEYSNSDPRFISDFFKNKNYSLFKINRFSISKITERDLISRKASNWVCIPIENNKLKSRIYIDLILRSILPWYLLKTLPNKK